MNAKLFLPVAAALLNLAVASNHANAGTPVIQGPAPSATNGPAPAQATTQAPASASGGLFSAFTASQGGPRDAYPQPVLEGSDH